MPDHGTWMPLYVGDYLSDTMHLTRSEHGAYMLLIMAYWKRGGPLPDDSASLAAITKSSLDEWEGTLSTGVERALNARCRPFFSVHDGFWHHKRIDEELERATLKIEQKRRAGRASANARSTDVPTSVQRTYQRRGNASPSPSPLNTHTGPDVLEVIEAGKGINLTEDECRKFYGHYASRGWVSHGSAITDWKAALLIWTPIAKKNGSAPRKKINPFSGKEIP